VSVLTIVRLGFVAMSMELQNCSPSQTMTYKQFSTIKDREAAIGKLERIATSNLENCLRLLKHCWANNIQFFRFSSRLIPLANHEELEDWKFMRSLKEPLKAIAEYLIDHPIRVDFHPDHFVLLNSTKEKILKNSLKTLAMHEALLKGMKVDTSHRCVLHVGGAHDDKEQALEQFIENWGDVPERIQKMIILENDDTSFTLKDTLYLCEKLGIPLVFDYHHHLANHETENWGDDWERVIATWENAKLPIKMHISSPRSKEEFRAHSDTIDFDMFWSFLREIKGTVPEIHCMIEAKQKDQALFELANQLSQSNELEQLNQSSFLLR
jgi:UV DNA damage endonuclease